ncbi:SHOCT domain-containing protein [Streptomyces sp. R21]|uniref:SHOCT domain-containing protein n=1 Tax=Streptomyces sp. R21 TaxID=3238627 RepID=A0AB39P3F7_9ACTN
MPFARPARPLLRGALVGGTAYAAGRRTARAQQQEAEQQEAVRQAQQAAQPTAQDPAPPQQPSAGGGLLDELTRLGELRTQGLLTEAEFTAAKSQLLGT